MISSVNHRFTWDLISSDYFGQNPKSNTHSPKNSQCKQFKNTTLAKLPERKGRKTVYSFSK